MTPTSIIGDVSYSQFNQLSHVIDQSNDHAALNKAAQHFESLFIDMWLKSAREASRVLAENNPLRTPELEMHEEMRDHETAVHLAANGGIGLAQVIVQQLSGAEKSPMPGGATAQDSAALQGLQRISFPARLPVGTGKRISGFDSAEDFVRELRPLIEAAVGEEQIPPLGILSQAALETGWGQQIISAADGQLSHNLFGMKSESADEPHVRMTSREYGQAGWSQPTARFRSYPDWTSSIEHYLEKLKNSDRYADVMNVGRDVGAFAQSIAQAGYATDPQYAAKITNVYERLKELVDG